MKLTGLKLKNIKSYKELDITFSPFLNIFKGPSDSGKSGLVKALILAIRNKSTRNIRTKNIEGESFSEVLGENVSIKRIKTGTKNSYELKENGSDKNFSAMKTEVPFEIQKILNISDSNIQEQKDTFFLIDESPGNISKSLNKVSGLSEIDRTLKSITTEINSINSTHTEIKNRIEEDKGKIKSTEWSIKASKDLKEIEIINKKIELLEDNIYTYNNLLEKYLNIQSKINNLLPESILSDYSDIHDVVCFIDHINSNIKNTNKLLNSYIETSNKLNNIKIINIDEIISMHDKINVLDTDIAKLQQTINYYRSIHLQMASVEELIEKTESKLIGVKTCPLCQNPLKTGLMKLVESSE